MQLQHQTVLIIGGSQGMGLGAAKACLEAGAHVIIVGRNSAKLEQVAKELGDNCSWFAGDLEDKTSYETLLNALGAFDHLFISASPGGATGFTDSYASMEDSYLHGKLWLTFLFLQLACKRIHPQGSVTLLSGGMAVRPHPSFPLVAVGFAATEALAKALAVSLAPLRVNVIRPTNIEKDDSVFKTATDKERYEKETADGTLLRRIGRGKDIGNAVVYLASSSFITGQILEVDGGVSIAYTY